MWSSIQPAQVVEDVGALPEPFGLIAGLGRVLPEGAAIVDRANPLPQLFLAHPARHDPAAQHHLPEARALLLQKRDRLKR